MAQLTALTIDDFYTCSLIGCILADYLAEETDTPIDSIAPFFYSAN